MSLPLYSDTGESLTDWERSCVSDVFRLETRQCYDNRQENVALDAFLTGREQPPLSDEDHAYLRAVRAARARGVSWQRVHLVREPLSDYLRFELTWEYGPNVAAGEQVGIIAVSEPASPRRLPDTDFWLFDRHALFEMQYDQSGRWVGIERVTEQQRIKAAVKARDVATELAVPWEEYLKAHPELLARVPGMREAS